MILYNVLKKLVMINNFLQKQEDKLI